MATLHKEVLIRARPERIWEAVRDVGALHTRLVPGFVLDTRLEGDTRIVTFANGTVTREPIFSVDDARRRLAWTAESQRLTHYNAVLEVLEENGASRVVWTTDLLPNELAASIEAMQEQGLAAMKQAMESAG